MDDEVFYEAVANELEQGNLHKGLWTKALTLAAGSEVAARPLYVAMRVEQLKREDAEEVRKAREQAQHRVAVGCLVVLLVIFAAIVLVGIVFGR